MNRAFNVQSEWVHLQYEERAAFTETYGFSGNQGAVNLEGIRFYGFSKSIGWRLSRR